MVHKDVAVVQRCVLISCRSMTRMRNRCEHEVYVDRIYDACVCVERERERERAANQAWRKVGVASSSLG